MAFVRLYGPSYDGCARCTKRTEVSIAPSTTMVIVELNYDNNNNTKTLNIHPAIVCLLPVILMQDSGRIRHGLCGYHYSDIFHPSSSVGPVVFVGSPVELSVHLCYLDIIVVSISCG